jgi:thymidylate synthase
MTKTEYLYGKDFDKQILKKQIEVCEYKLAKIERLIKELLKVPYEARDKDRLREVLEARDWNEKVLRESEEILG